MATPKTETSLQGKQKLKRQRARRIAPDELSLPNTKEAWLLLNTIVYGLRIENNRKLERAKLLPTYKKSTHLFELPKGLVDKSNGKFLALSTANGDASCKIHFMAFAKAIEVLGGKGAARFLKYKFVHCLFLILDKFKMVSRTDGGEIVLTTSDLQDYEILPSGQGAKPLFVALRAILFNTELSHVGRLFSKIECTHGRLVLTTCRGDAYKNFCKYFCGVKKAALFELSQRELLALRYLVGVRAFRRGKNKSASLSTLIKFAGFSLGALKNRHFGKLQSVLNATLDKIQVFLNFDVAVDRSPQSLKALLTDGAVNLIRNKVKEYAQNARAVGFKDFWAHFRCIVEDFFKRHAPARNAENALQLVENEAPERPRLTESVEFSFWRGVKMAWVDFDAKCQTGGNLKRFLAANGAKKIGKSMACPFHNDKSPSASYYLKDGVELFNCFTCGIKGDIFNVYRKVNGVTNKSELNKLVGDFCGVTLPTFKKVEAPKYKFVKRVESAEIIKARKRAVEQYKALFKTPKGDALVFKNPPVPLVDKPSVAVEKPTELNVEKPAIKTPELKQNANVELKQTPKVELKPTAEKYVYFEKRKDFQNVFTNFENKPAKVFDLPSELNNLPRNLTASVKEWRDKQYAIFKNPKYKPNAAESIFISIEFNALKHCGFADFEARRGDYMRVAEWRARRAYVAWYSNKGDSNEKI